MGASSMTPMCGILVDCCAHAATGHVAVTQPMTLIKSRRLIAATRARDNAFIF
jgi:hypothetical protein